MGAAQGLIEHIDQVIECFNRRTLDLPDGFFDKRAQFVINGAPFETLLSASPNDPLVLMLARGPAGYRFTAKALQHAIPDAKIERPSTPQSRDLDSASLRAGGPVAVVISLSGHLRDTGEAIDALVPIALRLTASGSVEAAEATLADAELERIRNARVSA